MYANGVEDHHGVIWAEGLIKKKLEAKVSTCKTHDETARRETKDGDNSLQDLCHKSFRTGTLFFSGTIVVAMHLARLP